LQALAEKYPQIYKEVTGRGLLIGQHFHTPEIGYKVAAGLFKRGVLVAGTLTSAHTIRIEPPIVITYDQIDTVITRLEDTLKDVAKTV
jgi:putrescine aminotransferase